MDQLTINNQSSSLAQRDLNSGAIAVIKSIALDVHTSRLFKTSSAEQAMAIMLKGYELGLGLMASFEFIKEVMGQVALIPRGALALIMQSPLCTGLKIVDLPGACTVWMRRSNGFEYTLTFTLDDAKNAGLVKDDSGWKKYEANMLRWRAVGFCADVVFSDLLAGMKTVDQLGAHINQDGNVIEGEAEVISNG